MTTDLDEREFDLDALLVGARMVPPPGLSTLAAGRAVLDAALDTTADQVADRRRLRIRATALVGVAAAVAAAVVAGPAVTVPGHHATADAGAAVLRTAADSAGEQTGGWPHARYWHASSTYVRDGKTFHRQIWIGRTGDSTLIDPGVEPGISTVTNPTVDTYFGPGITWAQLYALPTEPVALAAALRRYDTGQGQNPDQQLFSTVAELLGESPAAPPLRRALYRVAAAVPGVRAIGPVTDRAGRRGQGVSRDDEELVIDTATGQLLQERQGTRWVGTLESQGPASTAPTPTLATK